MLVEDTEEMVSMFGSDIFNSEIIDDEHKLDRAPRVSPKAGSRG